MLSLSTLMRLLRSLRPKMRLIAGPPRAKHLWRLVLKLLGWLFARKPPPSPQSWDPSCAHGSVTLAASLGPHPSAYIDQLSGSSTSGAPQHPRDRGVGLETGHEVIEMVFPATPRAGEYLSHGAPWRRATADTIGSRLSSDRLIPMVPEFFQRYDRTSPGVEPRDTEMMIPALADFEEQPDPFGWKPVLHPEGVKYFVNTTKNVVTEADLYNPVYYNRITADIASIEHHIRANNLRLPEQYTLSMDLNAHPDGEILTDYYFADHKRNIIFFLDDIAAHDSLPIWREVKGVTTHSHIHFEFIAQYWIHGMLYPSTIPLTSHHISELRDTVLFYIGDASTSQNSTSPFSMSDLKEMLAHCSVLKEHLDSGWSLGATNLLCRRMLIFCSPVPQTVASRRCVRSCHSIARQKFYNWHGLPQARIYRDQSVHDRRGKRLRKHSTILLTVLSPALFSVPKVHWGNFGTMWVDGRLNEAAWREYATSFQVAQQDVILYSTVLLSANVAFLAIQTVDVDNVHSRSPVQIASYLSTVFSIGCIVMGLLLVRQPGKEGNVSQWDTAAFFRTYPVLGPEVYAILYSIPYSLLVYSMVAFFIAFVLNCFQNSNTSTKMIVTISWSIPVAFLLCCIWVRWTGPGGVDDDDDSKRPRWQAWLRTP